MNYIIMCGGEYPEWETPRQLSVVNGEVLVSRTIRLLKENGVSDIAITSTDYRFLGLGAMMINYDSKYVCGNKETFWVDAFYPSREPVCYLYGDVYYSEEAIKIIVEYQTDSIMFFASAYPYSEYYTKHWEEPYAFKVVDTEFFWHCINTAKELKRMGRFNRDVLSWELWQVIKGTPLNEVKYNYCIINDYSCDVDYETDIAELEDAIMRYEHDKAINHNSVL